MKTGSAIMLESTLVNFPFETESGINTKKIFLNTK